MLAFSKRVSLLSILLATSLLSQNVFAASPKRTPPQTQISNAQPNPPSGFQLGTNVAPLVVRALPVEKTEAEIKQELNERAENALERNIKIYSDALLAAFTFVLAISTILLWCETKGLRKFAAKQARDMRASINIAKQAADAASSNSEIAFHSELPIFIVENGIGINNTLLPYSVPLGNHGRTPAATLADCLVLNVGPLGLSPIYPPNRVTSPVMQRVVDPKNEYRVIRPASIPAADWTEIWAGRTPLWAYGYVDYLDFMKIKRREGFCLRFHLMQSTAPEVTGQGRWIVDGPPGYIYSVKCP